MARERDQSQPHAGHRQRVRSRVFAGGLDSMADHELIEFLLFYAIPKRDVNPLAHALLDAFGSLAGVLEAAPEELEQVSGAGPGVARVFGAYGEAMTHYLHNPGRGAAMDASAQGAIDAAQERFVHPTRQEMAVLCIDARDALLSCAVRDWDVLPDAVGTRWLVEQALNSRAHKVTLVWRRYGRARLLTRVEMEAFNRVAVLLSNLEICLNDFILLHRDSYVSLRESGGLVDILPARLGLAGEDDAGNFIVDGGDDSAGET